MSLRIKFVLALLFTGLAAVALVGGLTYASITHKVDAMRRQQAAGHFHQSVTEYLTRYGSWQAANEAEPFRQFMQRRHEQDNRARPTGDEENPGTRADGAQDDAAAQLGPPPERPNEDADHSPQDGPPDRDDRRPPPQEPPFHFILSDENFAVLLGAGVYRTGEILPESARQDAQAVMVNQRILAYVSPQGVLTPSRQELQYLATVREALLVGAASAALVALVLGLLLGSGLSSRLRALTLAAQAMQGGSLRQQVSVRGKDEVATLARAFNQMSEELAKSHEELQASHQTILTQADQLKELSIRDALTDLYNRRHFDQQAATLYHQSMRHGRPLSVVIGDIDFFKRINDQFSHAVGDAVLRQVSAILRSHMRLTDLVARYGGEEFVIALPETSLPQAAALCDKLRDLIEGFSWQDVHPNLKVTMSMGVCADLTAGTVDAMLQKADALLYRAKENGRNRVCFA